MACLKCVIIIYVCMWALTNAVPIDPTDYSFSNHMLAFLHTRFSAIFPESIIFSSATPEISNITLRGVPLLKSISGPTFSDTDGHGIINGSTSISDLHIEMSGIKGLLTPSDKLEVKINSFEATYKFALFPQENLGIPESKIGFTRPSKVPEGVLAASLLEFKFLKWNGIEVTDPEVQGQMGDNLNKDMIDDMLEKTVEIELGKSIAEALYIEARLSTEIMGNTLRFKIPSNVTISTNPETV